MKAWVFRRGDWGEKEVPIEEHVSALGFHHRPQLLTPDSGVSLYVSKSNTEYRYLVTMQIGPPECTVRGLILVSDFPSLARLMVALGPWLRNEISIQTLLRRSADEKAIDDPPSPKAAMQAHHRIAGELAQLVNGMDGNAAGRLEDFLHATIEPFRTAAGDGERTRADATIVLLESALLLLQNGETDSACKEAKRALQAWTGDPDLDLLMPSARS